MLDLSKLLHPLYSFTLDPGTNQIHFGHYLQGNQDYLLVSCKELYTVTLRDGTDPWSLLITVCRCVPKNKTQCITMPEMKLFHKWMQQTFWQHMQWN